MVFHSLRNNRIPLISQVGVQRKEERIGVGDHSRSLKKFDAQAVEISFFEAVEGGGRDLDGFHLLRDRAFVKIYIKVHYFHIELAVLGSEVEHKFIKRAPGRKVKNIGALISWQLKLSG